MKRTAWTPDELSTLKHMVAAKSTPQEVAAELDRGVAAVNLRTYRMGLKFQRRIECTGCETVFYVVGKSHQKYCPDCTPESTATGKPKGKGAKMRECLGCSRMFDSKGKWNRLCQNCRERAESVHDHHTTANLAREW